MRTFRKPSWTYILVRSYTIYIPRHEKELIRTYKVIILVALTVLHLWKSLSRFRRIPPFYPIHGRESSSGILLVSAYYPLPNTKHTITHYKSWLDNLKQLHTDMYVYTNNEWAPILKKMLAKPGTKLHVDSSFETPFEIPYLKDYEQDYRSSQSALDPEAFRHTPELYAVWNAKPFFLAEASRMHPNYTYYFWNDIGSFRAKHGYIQWPSRTRLDSLWSSFGNTSAETIFIPARNDFSRDTDVARYSAEPFADGGSDHMKGNLSAKAKW